MDEVLAIVSGDAALAYFVEESKWMQGLDIPDMIAKESSMSDSVLAELKQAVQKCADGEVLCQVNNRVLDEDGQRQFRDAIGELRSMLSENGM